VAVPSVHLTAALLHHFDPEALLNMLVDGLVQLRNVNSLLESLNHSKEVIKRTREFLPAKNSATLDRTLRSLHAPHYFIFKSLFTNQSLQYKQQVSHQVKRRPQH